MLLYFGWLQCLRQKYTEGLVLSECRQREVSKNFTEQRLSYCLKKLEKGHEFHESANGA